jgi:hypothetical protein
MNNMYPIELQTGSEVNLFEDTKLLEIGNHIKNYLNDRLQDYFSIPEKQQILIDKHKLRIEDLAKIKAVNTLQIGDIPLTANNEFPILKIYRISSNWKRDNGKRESYIGISYALNLPILVYLPGFLNWVDVFLNKAIQEWEFEDRHINSFRQKDWINDVQTSYSLLQGQQKEEFLSVLRTTMRILES